MSDQVLWTGQLLPEAHDSCAFLGRLSRPIPLRLVLVCYGLAEVDTCEKYENVCLDERNTNVQTLKEYRDSQRHQRKENQGNHFAGKHVREETDRERKNACQWLKISIGNMSGASHHTGPIKCLKYPTPLSAGPESDSRTM